MRSFLRTCALLALALLLSNTLALAAYPFSDDAEAGLGAWSADPPWAATGVNPHAGAQAFTDSPGAHYANDTDSSLTMASSMDLSAATRPALLFWQRHNLEDGFDFGRVEISLDGGASWQAEPLASFTGGADWHPVQLDLSAYAGQASVKLRFRLVSDDTVTQDGWTLDDILVAEAPAPVTLDAPTNASANTLALSWSASAEPEFAEYRLVRGPETGFAVDAAFTVATLSDAGTTNHTDIGLSPKSRYFYRVLVVASSGLVSPSNEVTGTTLAGMDFPLLDTGEGGPATWNAEHPWALSDEAAHGGTRAWSDSPGGDYDHGLAGVSLTLAAPVDLSSATKPVLSFWHRYAFPGNDHGLVEVSTNGGLDWSVLADYTGGEQAEWQHVQLDLSAYREVGVHVRFRVTTDSGTSGDGWHVDDIALAEQPAVVEAPALSNPGPHGVTLNWNAGSDTSFAHYAVHRANPSGASMHTTLVATLDDPAATSHTDGGLIIGETYAYRVYMVNAYGVYSPDSATESTFTTAALPLPFTEDFESGLTHWDATGAWSTTDAAAHGGSHALQDAPGNYPPSSDTSVTTQLDLQGVSWPVLTFWDRHDFEERRDWGRVEVSRDGSSWSTVYSVNGESSTWQRQRIDLSLWSGEERLYLRFRAGSDGANERDGWYIDDIEVAEHTPATRSLPFEESFEAGLGAWLDSTWGATSLASHAGTQAALDTGSGALPPLMDGALTLDGALDLAATTDPQLVFWVRGTTEYRQYFRAQVSTDDGLTWTNLVNVGLGATDWERHQYSLAAYRTPATRLRFVSATTRDGYWSGDGLELDDVVVREAPAAPALEAPVPHLKSMDLSWSAPAVADFARYAIYRSTTANVDINATLVTEIADAGTTSYTDTGLSIGISYHYRVYLVTADGTHTPSNEVSSTTSALTLPLVDPMESDANWVTEGTNGAWGLEASNPHGGASCMSDSPDAAYQSSADYGLKTAVDLSTAAWPVLTFWSRSDFELDRDAGRVQVSTNGGSAWTGVYATSGTAGTWTEHKVDLSPFKGNASVMVRFQTTTNSSVVADGWCVDDVEIADLGVPARELPFGEGFEAGADAWLSSNWEHEDIEPRSGTHRMRDFPRGAIPTHGHFANTLHGEFDLSATTNPQLVFWIQGSVGYRQAFNAQISTDGGKVWANLWSQRAAWEDWTRIQVSLASYRQAGVRFRFMTSSQGYWEGTHVALDDIAIAEEPDAPTMEVPVPHLKSMELAWSAPTLPNFARYELYRDTDSTVDLESTKVTEIGDPATTSHTDTGLAIGTVYYYRVYLVTDDEIYTPSNTVSKATVALGLPLVDAMESDDNWSAEGTNGLWEVSGESPQAGSGAFTDSPGGAYPDNLNTSLTTAVDLSTTSWPVLTFWDRFDFADAGDLGRIEVSTDSGAHWSTVYTATGSNNTWTERRVDLSAWAGQASLMLRFHSTSNGSGVGDGWTVDTLQVADTAPAVRTLPFHEDFESGRDAWHASVWETTTTESRSGSRALEAFPYEIIPSSGEYAAHVEGAFDLSATTAPRLTFWVKGSVGYRQYLRAQASTDGGITWHNLTNLTNGWEDWTRFQAALDDYRSAATRIRITINASGYNGGTSAHIDDISIEDAIAPPALEVPVDVTPTSQRLVWDRCSAPNFARYQVYRSTSATVDEADTLLATITDVDTHEYTDLGLETRGRYYYRVFVYSTGEVGTGSNEVMSVTNGVGLPFSDDFESDSPLWTFEGQWGREAGLGRAGSTALTDAPGVYPNNMHTTARFGIDLSGSTWPVLTFHEHHDFEANADWAHVEVSTDFGANWTRAVSLGALQENWAERRVDLSPWRNHSAVLVRFKVDTGASISRDGWFIDDLSITENVTSAEALPFYEDFENGDGRWLAGQWTIEELDPHRGSARIESSPGTVNPGYGTFALTLDRPVDLSTSTAPTWTFHAKGPRGYRHNLKAQISKDGGVTWIDLFNEEFNEAEWRQISIDLSGHREENVRFRFLQHTTRAQDGEGYAIDSVGIGEPTPGTPTLHSPEEGATVGVLRPTLTVNNAFDPQTDALTYHFEVYSDEALSNLVAEVPTVAEGENLTAWTVDIDLADSQRYWWRARANDGSEYGAFMDAASFRIVLVNDAPGTPEIVAPSNGAGLWGPSAPLTWYRSVDPNPGDTVTYDVMIDDDPSFATPAIDDSGITDEGKSRAAATPTVTVTLGSLDGFGNLVDGTRYYWRLRAVDQSGFASAWTSEVRYFDYGTDAIAPSLAWSTPDEGATLTSTPITLSGTASDERSGVDYVQVSTDGGKTWQLASGATNWSYAFAPKQNGPVTALARAVDRAGETSATESRAFTVELSDIPPRLTAAPDASVITLSWTPPPLPGHTGYALYRRAVGESVYSKRNTTPLTATSFRDTGLLPTDAFHYVVTALYPGDKESGYSIEAFARPLDTGRPPFVDDLQVRRNGNDLELSWSPVTTDPGTGPEACAAYRAYEGDSPTFTPDGATWNDTVTGGDSTTFPGGATDGQVHYFLVTAEDGSGTAGFWAQSFVEESASAITRHGAWSNVTSTHASQGAYTTSAAVDAKLSFTFTGTGFSLAMHRGPDQGIARVLVDGNPVGDIDLYATTSTWQIWGLHSRGLTDESHTVEIVVTGTKNAGSSGTAINLDRILHGR